eukprot:SAG31_NODE_26918_length_434_cov_0.767164_1_plen_68_part_01
MLAALTIVVAGGGSASYAGVAASNNSHGDAAPCRPGTFPKCFPAATARGWACISQRTADPKAVAGAVS